MEKKNMVLLTVIAVATLLVAVVGATFAYFTATIQDNRGSEGDEGKAELTIKQTPSTLIVEKSQNGLDFFKDENVLPGHKELVQLKVTSPADNETDTYFDVVFEGTNTFPQDTIKVQMYESTEDLGVGFNNGQKKPFDCEKVSEKEDETGKFKMYEKCELVDELTAENVHKINTQPIGITHTEDASPKTKTTLNGDLPFVITGTSEKRDVYYYVVVEYVNDPESDQTETDKGKSLSGKINVEVAAKNPGAIADDDSHLTTKATS